MSHQEHLARVYSQIGVPLDQLPYTPEMDRLIQLLTRAEGGQSTHQKVWRELLNLRKRGYLPRTQ